MSLELEKLARRVAALESRLAAEEKEDKKEDSAEEKEAGERQALAAQIEALESRLAADDEEEDDKDEKKASLTDPNGVEEDITLDKFTEVENLEHGTELSDGLPLDVAPTEYVARLKNASSRLDAVASYLEKTGRTAMALRIDKVADAIDARLASIESK